MGHSDTTVVLQLPTCVSSVFRDQTLLLDLMYALFSGFLLLSSVSLCCFLGPSVF